MADWFGEAIERVGDHPWLQGVLAALSTFVLEDPTTIGCGLLVADGKMAFATAFLGVSIGIALGDFGLYWAGRWLGPRVLARGWVSEPRLQQARLWFGRNLVTAILLSRFLPGMRLPTYLGAGVFRVSALRFLGLAVSASVVWTLLLLLLTVHLGEAVFPLLGRWRWPAAALLVVSVVLLQWVLARRREPTLAQPPAPRVASRFEFWPPWLFYLPVAVYYLWLSIRFRGATLPTAANPGIYAGGFIGESKSEILKLAPPELRPWMAAWASLEVERGSSGEALLERARARLSEARISLPVVAKPDLGQRGDGVQPVRSWEQLGRYLGSFPEGQRVILQELAAEPGEAGIFYFRRPSRPRGTIFSITLKSLPSLTGDGRRSIRELILADPRAARIAPVYLERHREQLERVPAAGEAFPLVFAANHCQGAIFRDGRQAVTRELRRRFDWIASLLPGFYFGRFDVKYRTLDELKRGEGFRIIEINGSGAEATHIWDADARLGDAYRTLFEQFRVLFEIGAENRRNGVRPLGLAELLRSAWRYRTISAAYPATS